MKQSVNDFLISQNKNQPPVMKRLPEQQWPYKPEGLKEVWRSQDFLAQIYEAPNAVERISVIRTTIGVFGNWNDRITWDELMKVKHECGWGNEWVVEVYPADTEIVNVANMRHLFVLPAPPEYAWRR